MQVQSCDSPAIGSERGVTGTCRRVAGTGHVCSARPRGPLPCAPAVYDVGVTAVHPRRLLGHEAQSRCEPSDPGLPAALHSTPGSGPSMRPSVTVSLVPTQLSPASALGKHRQEGGGPLCSSKQPVLRSRWSVTARSDTSCPLQPGHCQRPSTGSHRDTANHVHRADPLVPGLTVLRAELPVPLVGFCCIFKAH